MSSSDAAIIIGHREQLDRDGSSVPLVIVNTFHYSVDNALEQLARATERMTKVYYAQVYVPLASTAKGVGVDGWRQGKRVNKIHADNELDTTIPAGTILVIERGVYSDKTWEEPVRVIRDFTKREVLLAIRTMRRMRPIEDDWDEGDDVSASDVPAYLVRLGLVEAIDNTARWHVGDWRVEFPPDL